MVPQHNFGQQRFTDGRSINVRASVTKVYMRRVGQAPSHTPMPAP